MRRCLRRLVWLILAFAGLIAAATVFLALWLPGFIQRQALRQLEAAGFEPASGRLTTLTPWEMVMEDLRLGEDAWITVKRARITFSPGSLWRGDVDAVTLHDVAVAALTVDALRADVALDGWASAGEHRIRGTGIRFATTPLGDLATRLAMPTPDSLRIEALTLTGSRLGDLAVEPTTVDLPDGVARVTLRIEAAELAEVLRLTLDEDATGTGLLDGRLRASLRLTPPYRFLIREGQLRARPGATVRVRNEEGLRDLLDASVPDRRVRDELVTALRDFTASTLEATIDPSPQAPLRLHLVGRGGPVRRPVDLTLNLHGVGDVGNTPVLDYLLELRNVD